MVTHLQLEPRLRKEWSIHPSVVKRKNNFNPTHKGKYSGREETVCNELGWRAGQELVHSLEVNKIKFVYDRLEDTVTRTDSPL
jgi:hypothetical protein